MTGPKSGYAVSFFDEWVQERKARLVIEVRQSFGRPWRAAIVRVQDGPEVGFIRIGSNRAETIKHDRR
jgi:hypothetical protein